MTEKDIIKVCEDTFKRDGRVFCNIEVKVNSRLKATLGRCHYDLQNCKIVPTKIEISRQLLLSGNQKEINETIIHECAHALVALDTGENHGHDKFFKAKCQKLGISGDRCASGSRLDSEDLSEYKYVCYCAACHKATNCYYRAGKVVKNPKMYYSKCCSAAINIVQNY